MRQDLFLPVLVWRQRKVPSIILKSGPCASEQLLEAVSSLWLFRSAQVPPEWLISGRNLLLWL